MKRKHFLREDNRVVASITRCLSAGWQRVRPAVRHGCFCDQPLTLSLPAFSGERGGKRSRHSRGESREAPVANPVHVIFYRVLRPGVVEIVRVLHERMEARGHIGWHGPSEN
jgi:hypothetical protein